MDAESNPDTLFDFNLPPRLYASNRFPSGRLNVYSKTDFIALVQLKLKGRPELMRILQSQFGKLFELPIYMSSISGKLVHALMSRQLVTKKLYELWTVFGGQPLRFSMTEFAQITGLDCSDFSNDYCHMWFPKETKTPSEFWVKLLGRDPHIQLADVAKMLDDVSTMPSWRILGLALIILVDGVLIGSHQYPKPTPKYVDMLEDIDTFLAHPWGRESFFKTIAALKPPQQGRGHLNDPIQYFRLQLQQQTLCLKGFPVVFQLLAFQSIELLANKIPLAFRVQKIRSLFGVAILPKLSVALSLEDVMAVENNPELVVKPTLDDILCERAPFALIDGEVVDRKVAYMERLIMEKHSFKLAMWHGGDESLSLLLPKTIKQPRPPRKHYQTRSKKTAKPGLGVKKPNLKKSSSNPTQPSMADYFQPYSTDQQSQIEALQAEQLQLNTRLNALASKFDHLEKRGKKRRDRRLARKAIRKQRFMRRKHRATTQLSSPRSVSNSEPPGMEPLVNLSSHVGIPPQWSQHSPGTDPQCSGSSSTIPPPQSPIHTLSGNTEQSDDQPMAQDTQEQRTTPHQSPEGSIPQFAAVPVQSYPPGSATHECATTAYPRTPIQTSVTDLNQTNYPLTQSHLKTFEHIPQGSVDNIQMHTDVQEQLNDDKHPQGSAPLCIENIHMDTDTHGPIEEEDSGQLHNRSWLLSDELEAISTPSANHLLASHIGDVIAQGLHQSARQSTESVDAIKHVDNQPPQLPTKESSTNKHGWKECMADIGKQVDSILAWTTSNEGNNIQPTLVIDSSPTHKIPRNIPTTLEVQLATLLQTIPDPPPSNLRPHINCEDYALLEAVLNNNPTTSHTTLDGYAVNNKFLLDLATPTTWVSTQHMEVLCAHLQHKHSDILAIERAYFASPWLITHMTDKYRSFKAAVDKNKVRVDRRITTLVTQPGHAWIDDVDTVYVPMNWDNVHWVGLAINLKLSFVEVLDPDSTIYTHDQVSERVLPILDMLPLIINKVCRPNTTEPYGLKPWGWKRPCLFTKRRRSGDCGPVSMKLMELHAYGDPAPTMAGLTTDQVDTLRKEYVIDLYKNQILPVYFPTPSQHF